MNVANRKLFTNRDARAKLSSMGGIMASSPELLGEVQKFAEAGEVKAPMFLVQLPGLIGGNEFLHLTAVELQSLKASQPGLMDQRGVVIQQSTPEILSELNPAQLATTDNANVQRMFSDLGVELPQADVPVEVEGPGAMDRFKSMFAMEESPFIFSDTTGVSRDGRTNEEIKAQGQALIAQYTRDSSGNLLPVAGPLMPENTGINSLPVVPPAPVRDSSGNLLPVAEPLMAEATNITLQPETSVTLENQNISDNLRFDFLDNFKMNTTDGRTPSLRNDTVGTAGDFSEAERMLLNAPRLSISSAMENAQVAREAERLRSIRAQVLDGEAPKRMPSAMGEVTSTEPLSEMSDSRLKAEKISRENSIGSLLGKSYDFLSGQDAKIGSYLSGKLGQGASAIGLTGAGETLFDLQNNLDLLKTDVTDNAETRAKQIAVDVKEVTDEIARRPGDPGVGGSEVAIEDIDKAIEAAEKEKRNEIIVGAVDPGVGGPEVDIEDIDKVITEKEAAEFADGKNPQGPNMVLDPARIKKDIADGGRGSGAIIGGLTGTNQNLSPKDSVKAYQAMYKEMLGMDDEDEEKEKWHQMAMIGFAIAAGQDPNALSNIAGGLLEGTKMAKKDRMRKKDRDDKFTMMAIQSADEDRRTALAAGVRAGERTQDQLDRIALNKITTSQGLIDESRKSKQSLELYEAKLKIAKMYDTPNSILKTDPALAAIKEAIKGVDYDMLGTGENAFSALEKMGFDPVELKRFADEVKMPYTPSGSAGVGEGVTGTGGGLTNFNARANAKKNGTN